MDPKSFLTITKNPYIDLKIGEKDTSSKKKVKISRD